MQPVNESGVADVAVPIPISAPPGIEKGKSSKNPFWSSRLIYWLPVIPIMSTPLGICRLIGAFYFGVCSISRISRACFRYHWDRLLSTTDTPETIKATWHKEYAKERKELKKVIEMIARGLLESIPVIGNIGVYYSIWFQNTDLIEKRKLKLQEREERFYSCLHTLKQFTEQASGNSEKGSLFSTLKEQFQDLEGAVRAKLHPRRHR